MNINFEELESARKTARAKVEKIHEILLENFDGIPSKNRIVGHFHDDDDIWTDRDTIPDGTDVVRAIKFCSYSILIHHPQWGCDWKKPLLFHQEEVADRARRVPIDLKYQKSLVNFLQSLSKSIREEVNELKGMF